MYRISEAPSEGNHGDCRNQEVGGNGWNSAKIAQVLNLRIEMVEMDRTHIDRHNQMTKEIPGNWCLGPT